MTRIDEHTSSTQRKTRGRKTGWTAHPADLDMLTQVARQMNWGQNTQTVRALIIRQIGDEDQAGLRRLQRKWAQFGEKLQLRVKRANWERNQKDIDAIKDLSPALYARIMEFSASRFGKKKLKMHADSFGDRAHPMALGIRLLEKYLLEFEAQKHENANANKGFQAQMAIHSALETWLEGGQILTPQSLRELARRCEELALKMEDENNQIEGSDYE